MKINPSEHVPVGTGSGHKHHVPVGHKHHVPVGHKHHAGSHSSTFLVTPHYYHGRYYGGNIGLIGGGIALIITGVALGILGIFQGMKNPVSGTFWVSFGGLLAAGGIACIIARFAVKQFN